MKLVTFREYRKHVAHLQSKVWEDSDCFVFATPGDPYEVEKFRCDTHSKIMGWVLHLSQKSWMEMEVLMRFVRLACDEHDLEIERSM